MKGKTVPIPTRYQLRVKQRLSVVEFAQANGIRAASRHFDLNRKTIRAWCRRFRAEGVYGLLPRYRAQRKMRVPDDVVALLDQARREFEYGAARAQIWLRRVHKRNLPVATIHRVFKRLGMPRLARRQKRVRRPRQLKLFEKPNPGDSVQVDVKVVRIAGQRAYQYTALDDCTRFRVLRLYRHQNQTSSQRFFNELRRVLPFPIRTLQCDNGTEFAFGFGLTVQQAGVRLRHIRPRCPEQNGKVERSHRIDSEEFWSKHHAHDFDSTSDALLRWERFYNLERFAVVLKGETPAEKLTRLLPENPTERYLDNTHAALLSA